MQIIYLAEEKTYCQKYGKNVSGCRRKYQTWSMLHGIVFCRNPACKDLWTYNIWIQRCNLLSYNPCRIFLDIVLYHLICKVCVSWDVNSIFGCRVSVSSECKIFDIRYSSKQPELGCGNNTREYLVKLSCIRSDVTLFLLKMLPVTLKEILQSI